MTTHFEVLPVAERTAREPSKFQSTRILGAFSLRNSHADMISNDRSGEYAFFYGPGWHTDGKIIAENFDRHVSHLGSTHYGVHSEGEYAIDDQKEAWIKARKKDGFRPALIYAQSKGVMTVSHMFSDPVFRDGFGEVESLCFDSGVANKRVIKKLPRSLMTVGVRLPNHPKVERACAGLMEWMLPSECCHDHGAEVDCSEALGNSAASARTRLLACVTQLRYMWTHDIGNMQLADFGVQVRNKVFISSENDALVDSDESVSIINDAYGGGFVHVIDNARKANGHAAGTEHPRGVVDALTGMNRDNYRIRDIQPVLAVRSLKD